MCDDNGGFVKKCVCPSDNKQNGNNGKEKEKECPDVAAICNGARPKCSEESVEEKPGTGCFRRQPSGFDTRAIHARQEPERWKSLAVVTPIVMSTTFKQLQPHETSGYLYGRVDNPTRGVLEEVLANLDGGKHAMCFASGLGAITSVISMMNVGDHLLSTDDLYGGTNKFFLKVAKRMMGIEVDFVDATDPENVRKGIKKNTKIVYIESPTNPLMKVIDIQAVSCIAHQHPNIIVVVDNTFLSSYLQRPIELGADMVLYSLTKYMNGHTDVTMGAVVTTSDELHTKLRDLQIGMGIVPSPFDCSQVLRSLKTLSMRMEKHFKSGIAVGKFLEEHKKVEKVLHPALPSHPQHEVALRQCYGHSGMVSFYIKGDVENSKKFLSGLKLFTIAVSLGGYESLAEIPAMMTHANVSPEQRAQLGITDTLIRLSVGLEDIFDIIQDLDQALQLAFDNS